MPLPPLRREQRPVYREVLRAAITIAWQERRFWPLSALAAVLLSSGTYDVLLRSIDSMTRFSGFIGERTTEVQYSAVLTDLWNGRTDMLGAVLGLQAIFAFVIVLLLVLSLSCVAQGGLVYAIGAIKRNKQTTLKEAFRVGGGAFWPIATLNLFAISILCLLRVLMASLLSLALGLQTPEAWFLYFIGFLLFAALTFSVAVIQVFSLNAMILQGAPIAEALVRATRLFQQHWVVAIETALALIAVAVVVGTGALVLFFVGLIPLLAAMIAAAAIGSEGLYVVALTIGTIVFFGSIFCIAAFLTQLQYAAWTLLYRRLGEGGVVPKIHRLIRGLTGNSSVPE